MSEHYNRGVMAALWVKEHGAEESGDFKACGHFIRDEDFFESEKRTLLESFRFASIDDDIYALTHREELS